VPPSRKTFGRRMIDKILFHLKNSVIFAVQLYIQKVELPVIHPNL
jgi:hypothetical protein